MKKLLSLALCAALGLSLLAGCSSNLPKESQTPAVAAGDLKLGLAITSNAAKSAPAGAETGLAQMDSAVVAVLVDAKGVITDCIIDGVQSKISFDAAGKLLTPIDTAFWTKLERGEEYGMKKASSIGKEWSEQAEALAAYVVGKTVEEVKGIAMDETTKPTGADLAASVTISIGGYVAAIEQAVAGAQALGAKAGDTLGLGITTNMSKSKDAADDADGLAQAYSMYAAASFDAAGVITSCVLDGSQTNVNFNAKGEITNDVTAATLSKNQLKEEYGMKKASSIGKEWYEEAAAYAAYVTGKTLTEVSGIAVDETGHPTGSDLAASVTVSVGDFNDCLNRAGVAAGVADAVSAATAEGEEPAAGAMKTGLAVVSGAAKSKAAGADAGLAQMDSTVVAVLVDENGVIVDCVIDGVQTKVTFDATGKLTTPLDTKIPTKDELGEGYGMKKASSIGQEWDEQAEALAEYVIGKTVAEVKGIATDETTKPTGADLAASVTISIGGYVAAIEQAVAGAQDLGAKAGDELGLGIDTNIAKSKDAAPDADGLAQAYSMYAAVSFDDVGKITSCVLDGSQTNVNFNAKGEITNDITAATLSKNQLKEEYGMKKASSIGKEWYEEAAAYAAYVTGKTMAEVSGIAVDETGHPAGADLAASVTVSVGAFNTCLTRAADRAD